PIPAITELTLLEALQNFTSEIAVAAGVRRKEALTGSKAMAYMANKIEENKAISALLKTQKPVKAIEKLLQEKNSLQKKVEQLQKDRKSTRLNSSHVSI